MIAIPIAFYVHQFGDSGIASEPQVWGVLGDYIGGVLNPIISFASLCVLGYLTYLVAQQTNEESKKLFILERRMQAYDELAKFIKPINSMTARMSSALSMLPIYSKLPNDQALPYTLKVYEELKVLANVFMEFHFTLFEFNIRYGHLFKYDFNLEEYRALMSESRRVSEMMSGLVSNHEGIYNLPEDQRDLKKLRDLLFPVFVALRKEVDTKLE